MSLLSQFYPAGGGGGAPQPASIGYLPDTAKIADLFMIGGGGGGGSNIGYSGPLTVPGAVIRPIGGTTPVQVPRPIGSYGGGGGAGGIRLSSGVLVDGTYTITIGSGGASGGTPPSPEPARDGEPGGSTKFYQNNVGEYVANGGGGGGAGGNPYTDTTFLNGQPGGCGGGGGGSDFSPSSPSKLYGSDGTLDNYTDFNFIFPAINDFSMNKITSTLHFGAVGSAGTGGGSGFTTSILTPSSTFGIGGVGGEATPVVPGLGAANTGEGGGGGGASGYDPVILGTTGYQGANGGSGVFIIRWPTNFPDASSVTGNDPALPSTGVYPGYYTYRWKGDGSITF